MGHGSLIMTQNLDLKHLSRKALRAYVLSHREDEEALRLYMDRLHSDPDVIRHTGGFDQEGYLEELIRQQAIS
jgi:hypothetical protein